MKKLVITTAALLFCGGAMAAGPECTTEDPGSWMPEEDFKQQALLLGYDANSLNVSEGNCYTLTALNAESAEELDYFNPMTGQMVEK